MCADLRGYGDSSKPPCVADRSNDAFRAMAADQVALIGQFGFSRFHLVGHDRVGRTGHRMVLDRPDAVLSLAVLDIAPTYAMFMDTNRHVAGPTGTGTSCPSRSPSRSVSSATIPTCSTRPAS